MTSRLPLLVDLAGRLVAVVGGGTVAELKTRSLEMESPSPPRLRVVAPEISPGLRDLLEGGGGEWRPRPYLKGDLDGAWLAVAATSSATVNAAVAAEAEEEHVWCIRVDDAAGGSAALPAVVRRGPLLVTVSTAGSSPALATRLRSEIAERYGPEWGVLAEMLGDLRRDPRVQEALSDLPPDIRRRRWHAVIRPDIVYLIRSGRLSEAKEVATACLCSSSD